jgi:EAL domain-containing protein (putative c-di-GMP-specific phosphodiesterase class I)
MKEWDDAGLTGSVIDLHVNLSPRQLLQPNFVERVEEIVGASGVAPERLHLEVTESLLIDNADAAAQLLRRLCALNVKLSLDDFGTGYSSLSSLREFPFDMLKIDRSFLLDADAVRGNEIVRTISGLARVLGMAVTVEGLEIEEQAKRMRGLGVDYAQGFYFARPLPPDAAAMLLEKSLTSEAVVANPVTSLNASSPKIGQSKN